MDPNQEILFEIKKLNKQLEKITHPGKHMAYNFLAGTFHTLGTIFGTLIIISIVFYFLSKVNLAKPISQWIEDTLSQVRWGKIIAPQVNQIQQFEEKAIEAN